MTKNQLYALSTLGGTAMVIIFMLIFSIVLFTDSQETTQVPTPQVSTTTKEADTSFFDELFENLDEFESNKNILVIDAVKSTNLDRAEKLLQENRVIYEKTDMIDTTLWGNELWENDIKLKSAIVNYMHCVNYYSDKMLEYSATDDIKKLSRNWERLKDQCYDDKLNKVNALIATY